MKKVSNNLDEAIELVFSQSEAQRHEATPSDVVTTVEQIQMKYVAEHLVIILEIFRRSDGFYRRC